jgi:Flp pilus assembly protein TadG
MRALLTWNGDVEVIVRFLPTRSTRRHPALFNGSLDGSGRKARRRKARRRGATTVELAVVAIPLFLLVFATIEFGRAMMSVQSLEEAARAGCRAAILRGATGEDVEGEVIRVLGAAGIANYTVSIVPSQLSSATQWSPVSVSVSATFDDMSWLPAPEYFAGITFAGSCTLPREAKEEI